LTAHASYHRGLTDQTQVQRVPGLQLVWSAVLHLRPHPRERTERGTGRRTTPQSRRKGEPVMGEAAGSSGAAAVRAGRRVQLTGLQARADLNGSYATALKFEDDSGRWMVRLNGGETIKVHATPQTLASFLRFKRALSPTLHTPHLDGYVSLFALSVSLSRAT
jgi:hypothetical protein